MIVNLSAAVDNSSHNNKSSFMKSISAICSLCVAACMSLLSTISLANQGSALSVDVTEDKPLWEAGLFSAAFRGPIYPAAEDYQNKFLPVPFLIYRGDVIRIGDESIVKAVAVEKETFKLDVSIGGAFNADSDESKIRDGMPDLDFMFEIGPEASFLLSDFGTASNSDSVAKGKPAVDKAELWLNLQLRSVFSTDFERINHRGYVFQPEFAFTLDNLFFDDSRFFLSVAPTFTTDKTQQYFYDVQEQYARPDRPFYESDAGYLGSKVSIANRVMINPELMIFVGAQLGFWHGAENKNSALYQDEFTYAIALGVKWTLFSSEEKVK
ncbi:MipA/OmpV family protein [Thalassotalea sp. HSM 43]|nr:MipA/OmpV family protein [Thalassotalea sp. HSM 43]